MDHRRLVLSAAYPAGFRKAASARGIRLFEPKEFSIQAMNALREAEGNAMTTEAIAESIIKDKGLDEPAGRMIRGRCGHCAEGVAQAWDCGDDRRNAIALGHRMSRFRGLPQSATAPTRNCLDFG